MVNDSQETTNTDDEESVENTDTEDIFVEDTQDAIVEELLESINTGNVYLIEENEIAEIENLININKMRIVQIKNDDSVTFTFPVGYMTTVEGMEKYDFSTEIISDLEQMKNLKIDAEQCVLRINYNHSGELPGTAVITIPVGTEWSGQKLYYYQVYEYGTCKYTGKCAVVDENGNYSISQAHCSDYILSLAKPAGMVMENEKNSTTEKINDANKMPVYIIAVIIAVVVLAVVGIGIIWLKKNYVMRRR